VSFELQAPAVLPPEKEPPVTHYAMKMYGGVEGIATPVFNSMLDGSEKINKQKEKKSLRKVK
jgi:hypothetical protein